MIKQIEFKANFENVLMTGEIEIKPIHEATGEIKIIMENKTEDNIIKKIDNYFEFYDKNIRIEPNGDIVYTIEGNLCRIFKNLEYYMDNVFKIGFG